MRTFAFAALAAVSVMSWAAPAEAQSCVTVPVSHGHGEVSGFVLDGSPLCLFIDRAGVSGQATLHADNACFDPDGEADCTRSYSFRSGNSGFRFFVYQDQLRAGHEVFTLRVTLH